MAKIKFVNTVKYKGEYHPAHSPFEVDDNDVEALIQKGAIVIVPPNEESVELEQTAEPEQTEELAEEYEEPVDKMTVPELKAYAKKHGIDISGVERKADILATIKAAESSEG